MSDTPPNKKRELPSDLTHKYAHVYLTKGWRPIPVRWREKNPNRRDWVSEIHTPSTIADPEIWPLPCNVGIILGDVSGGLVDIDLDCPEAIALASKFLPTTPAVFGRRSKRDSHFLYVCRGQRSTKFEDIKRGDATATLCELRANNVNGVAGFHTVFPPSCHRDTGELIVWRKRPEDPCPDPATVSAQELQLAVRKLAVASLLVRHWAGHGSRHSAALALGGLLVKTKWQETDCLDFARAVFEAAGCEDVEGHVKCVRDTLAKSPVEKLAGGPTLARLLGDGGDKIVEKVHSWLRLSTDASPRLGHEEPLDVYESGVPIPFTRSASNISFPVDVYPKVLKDYARAIAEAMQVDLDFICVAMMGFLGAVLQRRLTINIARDWQEVAVLWTAIVAPPGSKKSPIFRELARPLQNYDRQEYERYEQRRDAIDRQVEAEEALGRAKNTERINTLRQERRELQGPQFLISQDITVEMMIRELKGNPSFCLMSPDSNLIQNFVGRYGSKSDDIAHLLNAYDGGFVLYKRVGQSADPVCIRIPDARVGTLGFFQHPGLDALNEFYLKNKGVADRICYYVAPKNNAPRAFPGTLPPIPLEMRQAYDALIDALLTAPSTTESAVHDAYSDDIDVTEMSSAVIRASTTNRLPPIHLSPPEYLSLPSSGSDKSWFMNVFDFAEENQLEGAMFESIAGWVAKWPGKVARLVGILEVVRKHLGESPPSTDDLVQLAAFYLAHADNATNQAGTPGAKTQTTNDECQALLARLRKLAIETGKTKFSGREVLRNYQKAGNMARIDELLEILEHRGYIQLTHYSRTSGKLTSAQRVITLSQAPGETPDADDATTNGASSHG
jgi:hypothetical protein